MPILVGLGEGSPVHDIPEKPETAGASNVRTVSGSAGVDESRRAQLRAVGHIEGQRPDEVGTLTVGYDKGISFFSSCVYAAIPLPCGKNREDATRFHPASPVTFLCTVAGEMNHG
jgi:hypothetical protein